MVLGVCTGFVRERKCWRGTPSPLEIRLLVLCCVNHNIDSMCVPRWPVYFVPSFFFCNLYPNFLLIFKFMSSRRSVVLTLHVLVSYLVFPSSSSVLPFSKVRTLPDPLNIPNPSTSSFSVLPIRPRSMSRCPGTRERYTTRLDSTRHPHFMCG